MNHLVNKMAFRSCQVYPVVMFLLVHSSGTHAAEGHYNMVTPAPGCNGKPEVMGLAMYDAIQFFKSPGYPGNYPNNADCVWIIEAEKLEHEQVVRLSFDDFETENGSDFLEIRDGKDSEGTLLGKFYGQRDSSFDVVSESQAMWIRFQSDSQGTYKGFSAQYVSQQSDRVRKINGDRRLLILCGLGITVGITLVIIFGLCICMRRKNNNNMQLTGHTGELLPAEDLHCYRETDNAQPHLLYVSKCQGRQGPPPCYTDVV